MSTSKIMIIRHAEKAEPGDGEPGVDRDGKNDDESLIAAGCRRAQALVNFFANPSAAHIARPDYLFAANPNGDSKRPLETVTPLGERLWPPRGLSPRFDATHDQDDLKGLVAAVTAKDGAVLICWEHKHIPGIVSCLPNAPETPEKWPGDRFDVVWVFDAANGGWLFSQVPQNLLPGDADTTISK